MARALWPNKRKLSEIAYLSRRYPVWCKLASNLSRIKTDTHDTDLLPQIIRLLTETEESLTLLKEYRTALISTAFTGKTDVRREVQNLSDQPQPKESAHA